MFSFESLLSKGPITSSANLMIMAYAFSSFGKLPFRFYRGISGLESPMVSLELRSLDYQKKLYITYVHYPEVTRVFSLKNGESEVLSKEEEWLLKSLDKVRTFSPAQREVFYYKFLNFRSLEIGDEVNLDKLIVAEFLANLKDHQPI